MARARNIKPGFFQNEYLVELAFEFRLLFIGLWTLADRDGRLEDRPKKIKMELFPADDVNIEEGLSGLEALGFLERYAVNGKKIIQITNFLKHQRPHHTEKSSDLPNKDGSLTVSGTLNNGESHVKDMEQDGENPPDLLIPDLLIPDLLIPDLLNDDSLNDEDAQKRGKPKRNTQLPDDFELSEASIAYAQKRSIDIDTELEAFRNFHTAKGNTMRDWQAAWRTWCGNSVKFGKANARASPQSVNKQEALEQRNAEVGRRWLEKQRIET